MDCIVVGAGFAGLAAAAELVARGRSVLVLEARDRVGGRVETGEVEGHVVDFGGEWASPGQDMLVGLIEKVGAQTITPDDSNSVVRSQGENIINKGSGTHKLSAFEVADLGQGLMRFRRLTERIESDAAWTAANRKWLDQLFSRWLETNVRTPGARAGFRELLETAASKTPVDNLTLWQALELVQNGTDLESLFTANGGLQARRLVGGMGQVSDMMAAELGDVVKLNQEVVAVRMAGDGSVIVVTAAGDEFSARTVLMTLPPWLVTKLDFEPALPEWRAEVTARTLPGNVIKAFAIYDKPWWREKGLSGQTSNDEGPVHVTFDVTDPDSERGILMGFFSGPDAESVSNRSETLRDRAFTTALVSVLGEEARQPHVYVDRVWAKEKYSEGCHGAHFAPGVWTVNGQLLAEPVGPIHFAGGEYAEKFNGYLEGALRSGRDEAIAIDAVLAANPAKD